MPHAPGRAVGAGASLAYALNQLHSSLRARLERALADESLGLRSIRVLACLDRSDGMSQQDVCNALDVDRSEMVRIVDRLQEAGLLQRGADPADRRRHNLQLTRNGRKALTRGHLVIDTVTDEALSALSDGERRTLHSLLLRALNQGSTSSQAPSRRIGR